MLDGSALPRTGVENSYYDRLPRLQPWEEDNSLRVLTGHPHTFITATEARRKFGREIGGISHKPIIEITGTPGAGKSTALKAVSEYYQREGVPHEVVEERNIPFDKDEPGSWDWKMYQLEMALNAAKAMVNHDLNPAREGPVLADRGIYNIFSYMNAETILEQAKDIPFAHILNARNEVTKNFFQVNFGYLVNALTIVKVDSEESIRRSGAGRVRTPEYLGAYNKSLDGLIDDVTRIRVTHSTDYPIIFATIDGNKTQAEVKNTMLKTIGSICHIAGHQG